MNKDSTQIQLIARVAAGDREAFRELYSIYEPRLYSYLMKTVGDKTEAEDLVVDTMFAVWKDAKRFRGNSKLSTWIFGIAHNKALNAIRSRARHKADQLDNATPVEDQRPGPEEKAEAGLLRTKLRAALARLSAEHRQVVELTFYEDFSYEEIARVMSCPVNTVKTRMFHARRKLKELLAERGLAGGH